MRCFGTFDVLPFVEFKPADGITQKQSFKLLSQTQGDHKSESDAEARGQSSFREPTQKRGGMSLDGGDILGGSDDDDDDEFGGYGRSSSSRYGRYGSGNGGSSSSSGQSNIGSGRSGVGSRDRSKEEAFNRQLMRFQPGKPYKMVVVDSKMLLAMNGEDCTIVEAPTGKTRFLRNMMPEDGQVTVCSNCGCFFRTVSFEFSYLRDGGCPFCKSNNTGTDLDDVEIRSIEANRKAAEARGEGSGRGGDRWEVHRIVVG